MRDIPSLATVELQDRLTEIRTRHPAFDPQMVAEVVRAVLSTMHGDLSATETSLLSEVEELGQSIATAKAEIAALRVDDINANHIPAATDELDAIIAHTAAATNSILEVCETLDGVAAALAESQTAVTIEASSRLQDATTKIYEACGFQDITGQRITKIVATLKAIESKVGHIVSAFGVRRPAGPPASSSPAPPSDDSLLNGPQLPAQAMDQSDIDKLMASFD